MIGTYCDVPINKCSKELCMKNEICIPSDQRRPINIIFIRRKDLHILETIGFSCVCPPGFKGERCSQATCSDPGQCSQGLLHTPPWSRKHLIILDESISLLGNGYFQMQVATSLESRMVCN